MDFKISKVKNLDKNVKHAKHAKCAGYSFWTDCGYEYDCAYQTTITCDDCKYGGGNKNPEAKCNQNN